MRLTPRIGYCLISLDPDLDSTKFGIILPNNLKVKPRTGFVHLHRVSASWDEVDLTGRRVVVDRWASRPFKLSKDGKEYEFRSISQWCVLAVIEEESVQ